MSAVTTPAAPRGFLTVAEAADLLRCSEPTIRRRIRDRELAAVKLGPGRSVIRIPRAALEAWLVSHSNPSGNSPEGSKQGEHHG
jgi:excisionase family DNA binding protein